MSTIALYLLLGMVLVELNLRAFFQVNFGEAEILKPRQYLWYRLGGSGFYLILLWVTGYQVGWMLLFLLAVNSVDLIYQWTRQYILYRYPMQTFCGITWLFLLVVIACTTGEGFAENACQQQAVAAVLLDLFHRAAGEITVRMMIVYLIGYMFAIYGANRIVAWVLHDLRYRDGMDKNGAPVQRVGRYIGGLERIFVLTFILMGQFVFALGFVFTAKTVARFDFVRKQAEYYLVGTLTSLLLALITSAFITVLL